MVGRTAQALTNPRRSFRSTAKRRYCCPPAPPACQSARAQMVGRPRGASSSPAWRAALVAAQDFFARALVVCVHRDVDLWKNPNALSQQRRRHARDFFARRAACFFSLRRVAPSRKKTTKFVSHERRRGALFAQKSACRGCRKSARAGITGRARMPPVCRINSSPLRVRERQSRSACTPCR